MRKYVTPHPSGYAAYLPLKGKALQKGMIKMSKMNVRKMKMRCDVKGCKNVDSYCISRSAELGGVVICEDCLRDALTAIENYVEPKKKTDTKPPELFYSGIEDIVSETVTPQAEMPNTETEDVLHPVEDGEPNTETDDVLQSVGDGVPDVPNTRTNSTNNEGTPHPSEKPTTSKPTAPKRTTPKRAAKKKTAERGNDK